MMAAASGREIVTPTNRRAGAITHQSRIFVASCRWHHLARGHDAAPGIAPAYIASLTMPIARGYRHYFQAVRLFDCLGVLYRVVGQLNPSALAGNCGSRYILHLGLASSRQGDNVDDALIAD